MTKTLLATLLLMGLSSQAEAQTLKDVAAHWAPVIHHQTHSLNPKADWMTRFDFDGDFDAWNNWENMDKHPLPANLYYTVSETETHWFIYYGVFHPRDWEPGLDNGFISHENDLEDMLFVVRKDGHMGELELIETQAHREFLPSSPHKLQLKHMNHYSPLRLQAHRPEVFVPVGGHGVYPYAGQGGDILTYTYTGQAEVPTLQSKQVGYALIPIETLWDKRHAYGRGNPFVSFAKFGADNHTWINSAVAPWGHDDPNDGPVRSGDIFSDPAYMISQHFEMKAPYSLRYLSPPLHTRSVSLNYLNTPDREFPINTEMHFELWVNGQLCWKVPYQPWTTSIWKVPLGTQETRYLALEPGSKAIGRWVATKKGILQSQELLGSIEITPYRQDLGAIEFQNRKLSVMDIPNADSN